MARAEVLIVGAGPTGLMLANQLARRGLRPRIVDRASGPAQQSRALAVHARTLEIYQQMGLADEALARGQRGNSMQMWVDGVRAARVPLGDIGRDLSRFPFVLVLGQDDNERILGAALSKHGIQVEWNTELVALEQHADHVRATLRRPDGSSERVHAGWIGGCDGGRSRVRELSGIGFPGAPYEQVFFVADTTLTGSMAPDDLNVFLWRDGFHLFFPLRGPDHWRVVGILPPHLRHRDDLRFEDIVPELQREVGADLRFSDCHWFSTYRIHHRRAARFRDRRVLLLGDAAHVHSPVGGQGMNTGLQDAHNAAWKLALVASGRADATLLDSYAAEREPVAERLLNTTDRAFTLVVSNRWWSGLFRTQVMWRVMRFAMGRAWTRALAFRTVSQIGIAYRDGPLASIGSTLPRGAPAPGERFPWLPFVDHIDDRRFALLCFGAEPPALPTTLTELVATVAIGVSPADAPALARAKVPVPSMFLLRPDGHIALAGAELDTDDLAAWFAAARIHG